MKTDNLIWYATERDEIPELAFGVGTLRRRESLLLPHLDAPESPAKVAFSRDDIVSRDYRPPSLFMLKQEDVAETLSWLRVYAKSAFPLSQFARVITDADWEMMHLAHGEGRTVRTDKWASIVLGEILAQGEPDIELESIPLSRAAACYSSTVARANHIHDSYITTRTCVDRLRVISEDRRLAKRQLPIDSLVPIWAIVSANVEDTTDFRELADLTLHAAGRVEQNKRDDSVARNLFLLHAKLFSDSAEERVVAFQRLSNDIIAHTSQNERPTTSMAALLAVGAFLVGRGTSHAFLLRKFPSVASAAFTWFGLTAALYGVRGWDPAWSKLTKGIERQLRTSFEINDSPTADLCWAEYDWLAQTFSGTHGFSDLARLFPRTLSVEIVPGATCQFRFTTDTRPQIDERRPEVSGRDSEMRQILEQLTILSNKARNLLDPLAPKPSIGSPQRTLGFEDKTSPTKPRSKKPPKKSDK